MSKKRRRHSGVSSKGDSFSGFNWGRLASRLQLILVMLVPLLFLPGLFHWVDLPRGVLIQVGAVFILLIWLMGAIFQGKPRVVRTPFDLPLLGFVLWAGLSLLWAHNVYEGFEIWIQWTGCLILFFLTVNLVQSERDTRRVLGALLLAGVLVGVLGIFQHLLSFDWVPQLRPPAATFANRNMAAQFMVVTIPLAAAFFLFSRKRIDTLLSVMALGVLCVFLFYTSTRAAWLAVTVEFLLLTIFLAREHFLWKLALPMGKYKKWALAVCVALGFLLINLTPSGFQWQVGTAYSRIRQVLPGSESQPLQASGETTRLSVEDSNQEQPVEVAAELRDSLSDRIRIWQNTLRMGEDHLIQGVGVGNFRVFYPHYARSAVEDLVFDEDGQWQRAHNDYVQIFAELGLVGVFFLGWLLWALTKVSVALLGKEKKGELRYPLMGVLVGLSGLLVNAFFSFPFQLATPTFVLAIYLGVLGGHCSRQRLQEEKPRPASILLPSWAASLAVALTFLCLLILLPLQYNRLRADAYFAQESVASRQKDWVAVISNGREGYRHYPYQKELLLLMGKAYFETGDWDAGIEATQEFLDAYPYFANAHHNLGMAYALNGKEDLAFRHFNQALEIIPSYTESHFAVALLHELRDNLDEALKHYRAAVKGDSRNGPYLVGLSQAAVKKGLNQEARDAFERAVLIDSDQSEYYIKLGGIAVSLDQLEEAGAAFSKAVELEPKSFEANYRLGMLLLLASEEREEGIRHLKVALELNPSGPDASQLRRLIEEDRKVRN